MTDPAVIFTPEYYERLKAIEGQHWWALGMIDLQERLLLPRLGKAPPKTFLDVGCGSGIGLAWAARQFPDARRLGVDVSEHALAHCAGLGAELHLADAAAMPVDSASIELALSLDVLQHVPDDRAVLREVARVLKPEGLFFVRTNARGLAAPPPGSDLFTKQRLKENLVAAGLRPLRLSRANCIGSLVAEIQNSRRRSANAHDHQHSHSHHVDTPAAAPTGGGYGGGLRLTPGSTTSLSSRAKRALLRLEGTLIRAGLPLPFGHNFVALAIKPDS